MHQLTEFEQGRFIGLREGGFSYRAVAARMKVISIEKSISVKCYGPKSSHVAKTVRGFFQLNTRNFFHGHIRDVAYWARMGFGWSDPRLWSTFCYFKRRTLAAHTSRNLKSVWLHITSYSSTCCSSWWLNQLLISDA